MKQKAIKIVAWGMVALLVAGSFGWNLYSFFQGYKFKLINEGANIGAMQIINAVKTNGELSITVNDKNGQPQTVILIEKAVEEIK